jgi:hypothetical protein
MKVTRTSGMPLEPEDIPKYHAELEKGLEDINTELGRFEKLDQKGQGQFVRRFEEMRKNVREKYKFEEQWDLPSVLQSKSKLKELVNRYGVIAFARATDDKKIQCFILDK